MSSVRLQSVVKYYGSVLAVDHLTFSCADAEFLAILGPSGCGKSTTMRAVAGLEAPTSGDIFFGERRVNNDAPARRNVAMAFEHFGLYPHMTVSENIGYPLKLRGQDTEAMARDVVAIAGILKIREVLDRYPNELSGGVRQRVSLARAMVRKPDVFLLDEPISHLDAGLRSEMRIELKRLQRETGATMIYVTHDQQEALTMADRVIVMDGGRLQQIDSPKRIYEHPSNRFVATFVGDPPMNLLDARIADNRIGKILVGDDAISLSDDDYVMLRSRSTVEQVLELGIRAEDLTIADRGGISGLIRVRESIGDVLLLTIDTAGGRLRMRAPPGAQVQEGEKVSIVPQTHRLHFFDPSSGNRIEH
ncbi:MAG TPA: ABC transporter ATP-binding protein [Nitrobacter sp.]|jgi:ABC-type sugar transport system ATPase subunit|nr:ABC transporter ATP-binding protein [Nitrobacter sp.]